MTSLLLQSAASYAAAINPLPAVGKRVFSAVLANLRFGKITLTLPDGQQLNFQGSLFDQKSGADGVSVYNHLEACVHIKTDAFWSRLLLGGEMGFAEGYMAGEVDVDRMMAFLIIMVINNDSLSYSKSSALLAQSLDYMMHTRLANSIKNAINNISAHYDLSNDMFASFLDQSMMYSSAVWNWQLGDKETLEEAQLTKIHKIIDKAKIKAGEHVLEVGSGWGGFAIEAVRRTRCHVVTITLSIEQKVLADNRIAEAEMRGQIPKGHIKVMLCDYRCLPQQFPGFKFDKIVSIEMVEAVGREYLSTYFEVCHQMLHPKHGIMVFQAITIPETRYEQYGKKVDFIQKHIFPGGFLPSITALAQNIHSGSKGGNLVIEHIENFAPHYAKTLQVWRDRFVANYDGLQKLSAAFDDVAPPCEDEVSALASTPVLNPSVVQHSLRAPRSLALSASDSYDTEQSDDDSNGNSSSPRVTAGLAAQYPASRIEGIERRPEIYTEQFQRKFLYYFDYCAAGFATRTIGVHQIVLTRPGNEQLLEGPYATGLGITAADL
ncbi:hypothetical protein RI367_002238 [Sorochytrium milnesiophthora]